MQNGNEIYETNTDRWQEVVAPGVYRLCWSSVCVCGMDCVAHRMAGVSVRLVFHPFRLDASYAVSGRLCSGEQAAERSAYLPLRIRRLPGLEEFRRGEVLVFNFPYPERWDSIGFDVLLYYVKRCIGEPGDTVEIRDAHYRVHGTDVPVGNTEAQERLSRLLSKKSGREEMVRNRSYYTFPYDSLLGWTVKDFGPLYVPARGDSIEMNRNHYLFYRNLIEWEQRGKLVQEDDGFYLEGKRITGYRFRENYYFMGGDNCFNSQDSRYWGLLPECYIVGKATRIWKSVDPYTGSVDWKRVWKRIE